MEEMNEAKKAESHATSAAAFVEGGIQEACDDACSICLEAFCESDPSMVTSCKHEFHLQCVLEWCQRSSNCPMCWRHISLKDPASQELLEAMEQERSLRAAPSRDSTTYHHPTFGEFELQHLALGMNDPELEDRIIQHLAAAAAMRRTHWVGHRDGPRSQSNHGRSQYVVFPTRADGGESQTGIVATTVVNPSLSDESSEQIPTSGHSNRLPASSSGSFVMPTRISDDNRSYASQSSMPNQDRGGPSELQSFSDTWKSRLNAMSMKYKESISKSTRGWKEKLFSGSSSVADISSEVRREVNAGLATVSRMMERLETRDNNGAARSPPDTDQNNHEILNSRNGTSRNDNNSAPASSPSN